MSGRSYFNEILVSASPDLVYKAITEGIDKWWTQLSNKALHVGDRLTVRFENKTKWVMAVSEAIPNRSLVWVVMAAHHDLESLEKKDEWQETTIKWEIIEMEIGTKVILTHQGLVPQLQCFKICHVGWNYFLDSLKNYLETGTGHPYEAP